jgi:hypothetical protein
MIDPFEIPSSERGVVRVFTTDLDAEGNAAITPENVQRLLGANLDLDPSRIEVFPSSVIEPIGLSTYLQEGYGIPPKDLGGTSAALDALKGLVVLVASGAFKGQAVTLDPRSGVRFVGAYSEPRMAPPEPMAAPQSAEGHLTPDGLAPQLDVRSGSGWPLFLGALVLAAALVLFLVF